MEKAELEFVDWRFLILAPGLTAWATLTQRCNHER